MKEIEQTYNSRRYRAVCCCLCSRAECKEKAVMCHARAVLEVESLLLLLLHNGFDDLGCDLAGK